MNIATDQLGAAQLRIDQQVIAAYAELTGDFNPIHLDPEFANKTAMGGVIAHGTLSVGLIWQALERTLDSHSLARVSLDIRFIKPVRLGDHLVAGCQAQDQNKAIYDIWVREAGDGDLRIVGTATLIERGEIA